MSADLNTSLTISASGMTAQTTRLRVIAQNIANQDTTGGSPGADPYQRRTVTFQTKLDRALGADTVQVKSIDRDQAEFPKRYDPSNPSADSQGYVKQSNVNSLVEMLDMREAQRSYSANVAVMQAARSMLNRTIDLLK
ncbi:MAG: flagellar basal body rod protein FlgC [Acetobacteraceae bacterium]